MRLLNRIARLSICTLVVTILASCTSSSTSGWTSVKLDDGVSLSYPNTWSSSAHFPLASDIHGVTLTGPNGDMQLDFADDGSGLSNVRVTTGVVVNSTSIAISGLSNHAAQPVTIYEVGSKAGFARELAISNVVPSAANITIDFKLSNGSLVRADANLTGSELPVQKFGALSSVKEARQIFATLAYKPPAAF
jgi:hypothetical protein